MQLVENFHIAVVNSIHRLIIAENVAENDFKAVTIIPFVQGFLICLVLFQATGNYFVKEFQSNSSFLALRESWLAGCLPVYNYFTGTLVYMEQQQEHRGCMTLKPASAGGYLSRAIIKLPNLL